MGNPGEILHIGWMTLGVYRVKGQYPLCDFGMICARIAQRRQILASILAPITLWVWPIHWANGQLIAQLGDSPPSDQSLGNSGTVPGGPYLGDRTWGTVPGGPYLGDRTWGTVPGGPYLGDRTWGTVPGGPYLGDSGYGP